MQEFESVSFVRVVMRHTLLIDVTVETSLEIETIATKQL